MAPAAPPTHLGPLRADLAALLLGLGAVAWLPLALWPEAGLPAWPSASAGVLALVCSAYPGRALPRGLGAFTGLVGLVAGVLQIAVLWGMLWAWPGG